MLFLADVRAQETTGEVPAVIIGVMGYVLARTSGKPGVASVFFGLAALALGVWVALVKNKLAAH